MTESAPPWEGIASVETATRVALAVHSIEATAANHKGDDSLDDIALFRLGAYTALWAVLFGASGDFPNEESRHAIDEVKDFLRRAGIEVVETVREGDVATVRVVYPEDDSA